jgi:hypothetical protein
MRPRFGARLVRSCSRYSVSTAASHGRGLGCERLAIAEVRTKWHVDRTHGQPMERSAADVRQLEYGVQALSRLGTGRRFQTDF